MPMGQAGLGIGRTTNKNNNKKIHLTFIYCTLYTYPGTGIEMKWFPMVSPHVPPPDTLVLKTKSLIEPLFD